jgi:hypothetical protein
MPAENNIAGDKKVHKLYGPCDLMGPTLILTFSEIRSAFQTLRGFIQS